MDLRRLAILARGTGHEKAALGVVSLRIWRSWPAMAVVACSAVGRGCTRLRRSRINNCLAIIRRAISPIIAQRTSNRARASRGAACVGMFDMEPRRCKKAITQTY